MQVKYKYVARDNKGFLVTGNLGAKSEKDALASLRSQNLYPSRISEESLLDKISLRRRKPKIEETISFLEKLAVLIKAGIPVANALTKLSESTEGNMGEVIKRIEKGVRAGYSFSHSFVVEEECFGAVASAIVKSGDATGKLDVALQQAKSAIKRDNEIIRLARDAIRYPVIVAGFALVGFAILLLFGFPRLEAAYQTADIELPLPTKIALLFGSTATSFSGIVIALALLAATFFFIRWATSESGSKRIFITLENRPVIGPIIKNLALARWSAALSTLIASGHPIISSVTLSSKAAGKSSLYEAVMSAAKGIEQGEGFSKPLRESKTVAALAIEMIEVGEETGTLDESLHLVSIFHEKEAKESIKIAAAYAEPVLILIVACFVLFLGLSVFLPMWEIAELVKR